MTCPSVLLVVADGQRRHIFQQRLRAQGYNVFATGSTPIALRWLERHEPQLVVADYLLPGTRMALSHLLKRGGRLRATAMIGIVDDPQLVCERARALFGYDAMVTAATPAAVLAKRALELRS